MTSQEFANICEKTLHALRHYLVILSNSNRDLPDRVAIAHIRKEFGRRFGIYFRPTSSRTIKKERSVLSKCYGGRFPCDFVKSVWSSAGIRAKEIFREILWILHQRDFCDSFIATTLTDMYHVVHKRHRGESGDYPSDEELFPFVFARISRRDRESLFGGTDFVKSAEALCRRDLLFLQVTARLGVGSLLPENLYSFGDLIQRMTRGFVIMAYKEKCEPVYNLYVTVSADLMLRCEFEADNPLHSFRRRCLVFFTIHVLTVYREISPEAAITYRRCLEVYFRTIPDPLVTSRCVRDLLTAYLRVMNFEDLLDTFCERTEELFPYCKSIYEPRKLKELARCKVREFFRNRGLTSPAGVRESSKLPVPVVELILCES